MRVNNEQRRHTEQRLATLLDRLASFSALALTHEQSASFERGVNTLVRAYELGVDQYGTRKGGARSPSATHTQQAVLGLLR